MRTRLKYWRRQRSITQTELAKKAGVSNQTIVNIEKGNLPKIPTVRKLIKVLNITSEEFYTENPVYADGIDEEDRLLAAS